MATENTSNNGNCCTSCGQTNCNNLTCGCADSSLTTPCGYSGRVCSDGNHEKCEEVYCENCVANCESKLEFEISSTTSFVIEKGERISKEMVERESIKYLFRLRNIRPELEKEIDALLLLLNTEVTKEQDDFGFESESKKKEYL